VGAVTDSYEYDAYGNSFTVSGSTPNEMIYRGEQYDSDLGLYYLRARYYNPLTGRFMSRDPNDGRLFEIRALHTYLYAGGDPANRIDPTGRVDLVEFGLRVTKAAAATVFLNTFSCGISLGFSLLTGGIAEAAEEDPFGTASTVVGCATLTVEPIPGVARGVAASVTLNTVSALSCAWGLYQAYKAENDYFDDLDSQNAAKAAKDDQRFWTGITSTFVGCEASLIGLLF
jgi:RHS repeat-associated protein